MQQQSLTFNSFVGLDYRTTKQNVTPVGKKNPVGLLECYGIIKKGVIQPVPALTTAIATGVSGKLFTVRDKLYLMTTAGLQKLNTGETSFENVKTQAFANYPEYWNIIEFKYKGTELVTGTITTGSAESYIKSSTTLGRNVYAGTLVEIFNGATSKGVYYVTSNDADTIYIEGVLDYIPISGDTFKTYLPTDCLYVYDGQNIYILNLTTLDTIQTINIGLGWIQKNNNRLMYIVDKKIMLSTINHGGHFPLLNYIYTTGNIKDTKIFGSKLYLFCDDGTYTLSGTGYNTFSLDKPSEYSTNNRIYPIVNDGRLFIVDNGKIYPFEATTGLEYNYRLNPDTHSRIYSTPYGIVFNLGHGQNKYGLLNIEEIKNEQTISISNFVDGTIQDIVFFNGKLFSIIGTTVYKENGVQNIVMTLNTIDFGKLTYIYYGELEYCNTKPATIQYDIGAGYVNATESTNGGHDRYPIHKRSETLNIKITATDTITKFILVIGR